MALIDDDQIEPQATGITNSAPEGTIPVTIDGDGNLGASVISSDGDDTEVAVSADGSFVIRQPEVDPAGSATSALSGSGAGGVDTGTHSYKVTFVTDSGETLPNNVSNTVTVVDKDVDGRVDVTGLPVGSGAVIARRIYRTVAGNAAIGPWKLLDTIANSGATEYVDNLADSTLGANAPSANTTNDARVEVVDGVLRVGGYQITNDGANHDNLILGNGISGDIRVNVGENGALTLKIVGVGAQMSLEAANGDADHVGGELTLVTGSSSGQSGGTLTLTAGNDGGGGDGGSVVIQSGKAEFAGEGGDAGSISIRAGRGEVSDGVGGDILITGGLALDGRGGRVQINPGASTNGDPGVIWLYSANSESLIEVSDAGLLFTIEPIAGKLGFFDSAGVTRPQVPASPNAQDIVNALVALGLITQAA